MSTVGNVLMAERAGENEPELLLDDRRSNDRAKYLMPIRVRGIDAAGDEELGTMIDLSRDGLYFTVRSRRYQLGMKLRVTLIVSESGWNCEVMRTEVLPNGNLGIGVRILR